MLRHRCCYASEQYYRINPRIISCLTRPPASMASRGPPQPRSNILDEYRTLLEELPMPEKYLISSKDFSLGEPDWLCESSDTDGEDESCMSLGFSAVVAAEDASGQKPSHKAERKSSKREGTSSLTKTGRTDTLPTAHVQPHQSTKEHQVAYSRRSVEPPEVSHKDQPKSPRRSSSYSGLHQLAGDHVFSAPEQEPNLTLDQSQFVREAEDIDVYRQLPQFSPTTSRRNSQSDLRNITSDLSHHDLKDSVEVRPKIVSKDSSHVYALHGDDKNMLKSRFLSSTSREEYSRREAVLSSSRDPHHPPFHTWGTTVLAPHATDTSHYQATSHPHGYPSERQSSGGVPTGLGEHLPPNITQWTQKHQDHLRRQHLEASLPGDLSRLQRAAEEIIKEKDAIIDRQKMKILEFEKQGKERYSVDTHIRELQYENASLRAKVAEMAEYKQSNHSLLEKKLGATEYELQNLKAELNKKESSKADTVSSLRSTIEDKDSLILELKEKLSTANTQQEDLMKKLTSQQRYMEDLPTPDEHSNKSKKIRSLQEDKVKYKQMVLELEKRLADATRGILSRDGHIEMLEENDRKFKAHITALEGDMSKVEEKLDAARSGPSAEDLEELEELRYQKKKLLSDLEKAKKLLETMQKKQQHSDSRHLNRVAGLEERLTQEEATVIALRGEMDTKDTHLRKLRKSMKELGGQNQDLLERCHSMEDRIREYETQYTTEAQKLEKRFVREMDVCLAELTSLVQICVQRAEGKDPNVSYLLGVKEEQSWQESDSFDEYNAQSLRAKITRIRDLRSRVDQLRELISNKFAEDMGENLNCTTH